MVNKHKKIKQILKQFEKKENYKLYLSYKSFRKTARNKLMLGVGTRVWINDLRFVIQESDSKFHKQILFKKLKDYES